MTVSPPAGDLIQPFQVERYGLRGRLVRLGAVADDVLGRHDYPEPVAVMLGQMMAVAASLAGALKYDGVFTLQAQGNGPIRLMVADVTSNGDMRAYAQFDALQVAQLQAMGTGGVSVPQWLGVGHLAFTVDQGPDTERYQGIVELSGESIADAVHHYFRQSEQLVSALKVAVGAPKAPGEGWTATALLLQRMPEEGGLRLASNEDMEDAWRTAVILLGSVKNTELLDLTLSPEKLLTRLFITIGVVPSARRPIRSKCRCSQERSERILASFPVEEVRSYAENGKIHMSCEFCRADYVFDVDELDAIVQRTRALAENEPEKGETP